METIAPGKTRLGWIGTGVMGASMCRNLMQAGFEVTLNTRSREKAAALLDAGATWAASPADVASQSQVVFSIVGYPEDVRTVHLGPEGTLTTASPGTVLVDMTTSRPSLAEEIYQAARDREVASIDAPVSGGDVGARNGTLSIMIGGDAEPVSRLQPCWDVLGQTIVHQGPAGSGQHTKMVNQTLIATGMIGVCEALLYAYRAGLDLETVVRSVGSGAAGSWSLANLAPRIIANDFEPGFYVEHFVKDMGIALDEANRMRLALPGLALAHQLYLAVVAQGGSRCGTQALQNALASLSGLDWSGRNSGPR